MERARTEAPGRVGHRAADPGGPLAPLDAGVLRRDFPVLAQRVRGKPLVYLDNAATTQKPQAVLDALSRYYRELNANIHRGVHFLSQRATEAYEEARRRVQQFLGARTPEEIVFVRGTTEAINLVARSFAGPRLERGDEIVLTAMEHHSNIVPWQLLREETGAVLRIVPVSDAGEVDLAELERLLGARTRLVSLAHVSNALGTVNPVREIVRAAHSRGVPVLLDGAQAAAHLRVDVQDLDCDFYAFSGHKLYGPTGIGVLYGRRELLEAMPPYQGGGEMIASVTFEKTTYNRLPHRFEAGTPHIAGAVGLGAAIEYVESIGLERIARHEHELLAHATERVSALGGIRIIGTAREKSAILSFLVDGVHPHDVGTVLDQEGVAIRAGHHCAQPLMERFGVAATARASFALYNTHEEVEALVEALARVRAVFG